MFFQKIWLFQKISEQLFYRTPGEVAPASSNIRIDRTYSIVTFHNWVLDFYLKTRHEIKVYVSQLALGNLEFLVRLRSLVMYRGNLSPVFTQLTSQCLWSKLSCELWEERESIQDERNFIFVVTSTMPLSITYLQ